jgi:ribosomal protein S18 acetylase RimI-like enzyme
MSGLSLKYQMKSFKSAKKSELESLCSFDSLYFPLPWSQAQWLESQASQEYYFSTSHDDKELLAFSVYLVRPSDSFAHLLKILVVPDDRKRGVGRQHFLHDKNHLKKQMIKQVYLEVETSNGDALSFYHSAGFERLVEKKNFYGAERHAASMSLSL